MDFKVKARKFEILGEIMETLSEKSQSAQDTIENHFSGPIEELDYYDKQRRIECEAIVKACEELMSELTARYK